MKTPADELARQLAAAGIWTIEFACDRLKVKRHVLWDWVRRSKDIGHVPRRPETDCPGCLQRPTSPGPRWFPHVDPPGRTVGVTAYLARQLQDADQYTAESTRGGNLRSGA